MINQLSFFLMFYSEQIFTSGKERGWGKEEKTWNHKGKENFTLKNRWLGKYTVDSLRLTVDRTSRRQKSEENSSQLTTRVASVGYWSLHILDFRFWIILSVLGAIRVFCFFALAFLSVLCGSVLNFFYLRALRGFSGFLFLTFVPLRVLRG